MRIFRLIYTLLLTAALALNGLAPAGAHAAGKLMASAGDHASATAHCAGSGVESAHGMHSSAHHDTKSAQLNSSAVMAHHASHGLPLDSAAGATSCGPDAPADCCQDGSCAHACMCHASAAAFDITLSHAVAAASAIPAHWRTTVHSLTVPPLLEPPIR